MTWGGGGSVVTGKVSLSDDKWDLLAELAESDDYWSKAQEFMKQVHGRGLSSMSDKQVEWYYNIDAALGKQLQYNEAKEAWGERSELAKRAYEEIYGKRRLR